MGLKTSVLRFAAYGAAGFLLGGILCSVIDRYVYLWIFSVRISFFGVIAGVLTGGAAIGLSYKKGTFKVIETAFIFGLVFFAMFFATPFILVAVFFIMPWLETLPSIPVFYGALGVSAGLLTGLYTGISRRGGVVLLMAAGALGFGGGMVLLYGTPDTAPLFVRILIGAASGIIGGGLLGGALGYMEWKEPYFHKYDEKTDTTAELTREEVLERWKSRAEKEG
jgi:hypothetical protein